MTSKQSKAIKNLERWLKKSDPSGLTAEKPKTAQEASAYISRLVQRVEEVEDMQIEALSSMPL